MLYCLDSI